MIMATIVVLCCLLCSVGVALLIFSNIDVRWWLREHRDYIMSRDVRWEKQGKADHQELLRAIRGDREAEKP